MTQAESRPCGQFLGAINDKPTEKRHTRAFLYVLGNVFRACVTFNPGHYRGKFSIRAESLYLVDKINKAFVKKKIEFV